MIKARRKDLNSVLESFGGIHLTAFLVNRGDMIDLKEQLKMTLREAHDWLHEALPLKEIINLLEPVYNLANSTSFLQSHPGSIAIYRSDTIFQVYNLPFEVERKCYVANSFHTKPVLRWLQNDPEFVLFNINTQNLDIYYGSLSILKKINSIPLRKITFDQQLKDFFMGIHLPVYLSTDLSVDQNELSKIINTLAPLPNFESLIQRSELADVLMEIRTELENFPSKFIQESLTEYNKMTELSLTKKNIFQISKATVQSRIKKLIIAEDVNIFGKLDSLTGGLAIHPMDLDCEDDDILDDLAQIVLLNGGQVVVTKKQDIPGQRPLLAILKRFEDNSELLLAPPRSQNLIKKRLIS